MTAELSGIEWLDNARDGFSTDLIEWRTSLYNIGSIVSMNSRNHAKIDENELLKYISSNKNNLVNREFVAELPSPESMQKIPEKRKRNEEKGEGGNNPLFNITVDDVLDAQKHLKRRKLLSQTTTLQTTQNFSSIPFNQSNRQTSNLPFSNLPTTPVPVNNKPNIQRPQTSGNNLFGVPIIKDPMDIDEMKQSTTQQLPTSSSTDMDVEFIDQPQTSTQFGANNQFVNNPQHNDDIFQTTNVTPQTVVNPNRNTIEPNMTEFMAAAQKDANAILTKINEYKSEIIITPDKINDLSNIENRYLNFGIGFFIEAATVDYKGPYTFKTQNLIANIRLTSVNTQEKYAAVFSKKYKLNNDDLIKEYYSIEFKVNVLSELKERNRDLTKDLDKLIKKCIVKDLDSIVTCIVSAICHRNVGDVLSNLTPILIDNIGLVFTGVDNTTPIIPIITIENIIQAFQSTKFKDLFNDMSAEVKNSVYSKITKDLRSISNNLTTTLNAYKTKDITYNNVTKKMFVNNTITPMISNDRDINLEIVNYLINDGKMLFYNYLQNLNNTSSVSNDAQLILDERIANIPTEQDATPRPEVTLTYTNPIKSEFTARNSMFTKANEEIYKEYETHIKNARMNYVEYMLEKLVQEKTEKSQPQYMKDLICEMYKNVSSAYAYTVVRMVYDNLSNRYNDAVAINAFMYSSRKTAGSSVYVKSSKTDNIVKKYKAKYRANEIKLEKRKTELKTKIKNYKTIKEKPIQTAVIAYQVSFIPIVILDVLNEMGDDMNAAMFNINNQINRARHVK